MLNQKLIISYGIILNTLELIGVVLMLMMAFGFQLILYELPCPLCLLQRVGFIGIAFGFLMNLRFGLRPSHYAIVLLSALFTSFIALRQIALHVVPGTGTYGNALFGLHLYTWSFIVCTLIVIATTFVLSIDKQYLSAYKFKLRVPILVHILFAITVLIIIANVVSVLLECGFKACPDDPVHYLWLLKT